VLNFGLSEEQVAMFDMARSFGIDRLGPEAGLWDETKTFPIDALKEAASLGLAAIYVREDFGGAGLTRLDAVLTFEGLSMGCPSIAAFLSIHNMCAWMIDAFASDALRAAWIPKLASMEAIASYCLTEPGSGSDAAALRTTAVREGGSFILNGSKAFISGAGASDIYVVMCRTGGPGPSGISTILVEKDRPGLSFGANEKKMGWNAQPTAQVQFDHCLVPASNLIGSEGDGFKYAMHGLNGGRLNIAACSLGGAQAALNKALTYAGERKAFGKPLDQFQALQFKLADIEIALQAARAFLRQAAWKLDQGAPDAAKFCAMAKCFVTDAAFDAANSALQILGGYGYLSDYGIEKIVRDLRVHQILEGTNEIMRMIIARTLLEERARAG
jgi:alkylation response protein AidB-like acyl-CoA dehydrogenase